jgi:dTDP-4-amino-4,6-dideoxygalactose transaminase
MREIVGDYHLPVAERLAKEVISLPVHPQVTQEDLVKIVTEVNKL